MHLATPVPHQALFTGKRFSLHNLFDIFRNMKRLFFVFAVLNITFFSGCMTPASGGKSDTGEQEEISKEKSYSKLAPEAVPVLTPEEALAAQNNAEEFFAGSDLRSIFLETKKGMPFFSKPKIVCWGDSLTARGGWIQELAELCGGTVYNGGTGGENAKTIMARQGGDVMTINNIVIPAECEPVTIAVRATDGGITTESGNKVLPLLQGGGNHVNPVTIGDIEGTLEWTGKSHNDPTGTWTFTRSTPGNEIVLERPTAIRTYFDRSHNYADEIMIVFMGQNGGYKDIDSLIDMHRKMIDHFKGKEYLILGLSSGSAKERAQYETAMKNAFGRRFVSLREYLSTPIFDKDGNIVSCYGLADQGLEPGEKEYNGQTYVALKEIATGIVPHQLLVDGVHFTTETQKAIGKMIYRKMQELNILP